MDHGNLEPVRSVCIVEIRPVILSRLAVFVITLSWATAFDRIAAAQEENDATFAEVLSIENSVDASIDPPDWRPATVGQKLLPHNWLRTGEDSRAAVRVSDSSIIRFDELTESEILPPKVASEKPTLNLKQGTTYFFSREKSRELNIQTPTANGTIRGTEFVVTVAANGESSFTMIEGEVKLSNGQGSVVVRSGQRADAKPDGKPRKTASSETINSIHWCLYYPGVLDLEDLEFSQDERAALATSLSAYRTGDLLAALKEYPAERAPASPAEKVYRAGLFLVVGQVQKAQRLLSEVKRDAPGRMALSTLVAAVTLNEKTQMPRTASDWIAESYYRQSRTDLTGAQRAARRATDLDPDFGLAWTRLAESEFALGRVPEAKEALEKGFTLAPRNPAAHALMASLLLAEDKIDQAKDSFEKALALNSALGDAWLGHGLCLLRQGQGAAGWRDLQTAAALEPNRAIFRRYLGEDGIADSRTTRKKQTTRPKTTPSSRPLHTPTVDRGEEVQEPEPSNPRPPYSQPPRRPTRSVPPKRTQPNGQPEQKRPSHGTKTQTDQQPGRHKQRKPTKRPSPTPNNSSPSPRLLRSVPLRQVRPVGQPQQAQPSRGAATQAGQQQSRTRKRKPTESPSPTPQRLP